MVGTTGCGIDFPISTLNARLATITDFAPVWHTSRGEIDQEKSALKAVLKSAKLGQ